MDAQPHDSPLHFKIFLSSPSDLVPERELVFRVAQRLGKEYAGRIGLSVYAWERQFMEATSDFQASVPHPRDFDLFLGLLWSRVGSPLDPSRYRRADMSPYRSGTEYEFEQARDSFNETGKPKLYVFVKSQKPRFEAESPEELESFFRQWQALESFKKAWLCDGQYFKGAHHLFSDEDDLETQVEALLRERIEAALEAETAPRGEAQWKHGSPFRGLAPFDVEHAPVFFGRSKARKQILLLLKRQAERGTAFVLVFGASGVGKSSLLRAGVLPEILTSQWLEEVEEWRHAIVTPSAGSSTAVEELQLLEALVAPLTAPTALPELLDDGSTVEGLAWMVHQEPRTLAGLVKGALGQAAMKRRGEHSRRSKVRLVLLLDQLEEVFTNRAYNDYLRLPFFEAIENLARSGSTYVLASLRSEFFEICGQYTSLSDLKADGTYHLTAPSRDELDEIIRRPAAMAGLAYEAGPEGGRALNQVLLDEAGQEEGALPLLQFTLALLHDSRDDRRRLTFDAYHKLGKLRGALEQHAETTYSGLSVAAKESFPEVMARLAGVGSSDDLTLVRRTAAMDSFVGAARELVGRFVEARLFTSDADINGRPLVAVTHEALLRSWKRVTAWADDNQEYLRMSARLRVARAAWEEAEQEARMLRESLLWREGRLLQDAGFLLGEHREKLTVEEARFLEASIAAARRLTRRRVLTQGAVVAVTAATVSGGVVYAFTRREYAMAKAVEAFRPATNAFRVFISSGKDALESGITWSQGTIFLPGPRERFERNINQYNQARNALYENRSAWLREVSYFVDEQLSAEMAALFEFQETTVHQGGFRRLLAPMDAVYDYYEAHQKAGTPETPRTEEERRVMKAFAEHCEKLFPLFEALEERLNALDAKFLDES